MPRAIKLCVSRQMLINSLGGPNLRTDGLRVSVFVIGVDVYLAESGDAEDDLALLQDMPSLPKLP